MSSIEKEVKIGYNWRAKWSVHDSEHLNWNNILFYLRPSEAPPQKAPLSDKFDQIISPTFSHEEVEECTSVYKKNGSLRTKIHFKVEIRRSTQE